MLKVNSNGREIQYISKASSTDFLYRSWFKKYSPSWICITLVGYGDVTIRDQYTLNSVPEGNHFVFPRVSNLYSDERKIDNIHATNQQLYLMTKIL
jgi:hypothetical protein